MASIRGISKTSLWNTWKTIRSDLRRAHIRDVIDYVDYDVDPDKWIGRLLKQVSSGRYEPSVPTRFSIGKSVGFSRLMTQPAIPDLVLYRAIVDFLYTKAMGREQPNVFFKQERLDRAQADAVQQAEQEMDWAIHYRMTNQRSFHNWLRYAQYRKQLLLENIHPYLVVTDITNFFDSVLHSHVEESLRGLPVSSRMVGLLFFLLERLSIRQDYSSSHGISLPVDQFDCSRTLAHLTLFSHDDAMVTCVGAANYIRWMDDQNMGVRSKADGLKVLAEVGKSLSKLHLSPNTKKSRVLTLTEARRHFHLDLNEMLDRIDATAKTARTFRDKRAVARQLRVIWQRAQQFDGQGEFDKILRRIYRLAGYTGLRFLRRRCTADVLNSPVMTDRICDYMRCSGTISEYLDWAEHLLSLDEQVYDDVNVILVGSLLRLEADKQDARRIRSIASNFLSKRVKAAGAIECSAIAPLLILRFGDRRSLPLLKRCLEDELNSISAPLLRAAAIVYASYGRQEFAQVRRTASRLLRNHLADVVRLVEKIAGYHAVPDRYKARLNTRFDSVAARKFLDMRALLTVRLLKLSRDQKIIDWVENWKANVISKGISIYDRELVKKLL